jgi:signal transduction histidine kinase
MVIPLVDTTGTLGILTASELDEPQRFGASSAEEARMLGAVTTVAIRRMLLLEELRRAGRAKDEFLAAVSHELRTPLNIVLGYVQLLSEQAFGPLTPEQADSIRRVEMGARSQLALVNDLLDLAAIERGAIQCDFGPVRLSELARELEDVVRTLVADRPITFDIDLPPALVARTDRERLKQVLLNLLANAAKFTTRGRISVQGCAEGDSVAIEVADTGAGMEPAFVQRATEPFVRGEGKTSGSGLGLAIVSRVLRALGGELAIDSRPGEGTSVRISLPAATPEHAAPSLDPHAGGRVVDEPNGPAGSR